MNIVLMVAILAGSSATAQKSTPTQSACVILSSVEPAKGIATWSVEGRSQKHMLTYLAGDYPAGYPFRSSIKDKDVDKIKAKGGRVLILDPHYTHDDLDKAKQSCGNQP